MIPVTAQNTSYEERAHDLAETLVWMMQNKRRRQKSDSSHLQWERKDNDEDVMIIIDWFASFELSL